MGIVTKGRRVYPDPQEPDLKIFEPGDYGFVKEFDGVEYLWFTLPVAPDEYGFRMFARLNPKIHSITVNPDGTVTASPSILVTQGKRTWHGYLINGEWREC